MKQQTSTKKAKKPQIFQTSGGEHIALFKESKTLYTIDPLTGQYKRLDKKKMSKAKTKKERKHA